MSEDQAAAVNETMRELGVIPPSPENADELPPQPAKAIPPATKPPPRKERKTSSTPPSEPTPAAPREYDPKPVVEKLNVWWLNGKDRYFQIRDGSLPVLSWGEADLKRNLRIAGVRCKANDDPSTIGKAYSQTDLVLNYVQQERHVDYAGPLAGKKIGVYPAQERRILVTSSPRMIQPAAGKWPKLRALLEGLLANNGEISTPAGNQVLYFYAWLKVAIESLIEGQTRPGHGLILAGPSDCGKSFVQEHVITPLLGGRSADPTKYLLGKTQFNNEMGGAEHLAMQELPSGLDFKSRVLLADELKRLIATESHAIQAKYCDALTLYPWWRVSLSINNNVDRLKALPALTTDFGDKVLLLLCESVPANLAGPTNEERRAFRETIASELPAFVDFLLSWEIPAELRRTKHASRFGHDHFHHPSLIDALFEQEPESLLLHILDNLPELYRDRDVWGGDKGLPAETLRAQLCEDTETSKFTLQARKLFSFPGACGTFLSKLEERFPERFEKRHTNKGNVWRIARPSEWGE